MSKVSLNKFIIEPYLGDRSLRANTSSGFAMIEQRTAVKPFKTLMDAVLTLGHSAEVFPAGSTVYIREELLFQPGWAQKIFNTDEMRFMIVEPSVIEFIEMPTNEKVPMEYPGDEQWSQ
jgi:hypothetical protein